MARIKFTTDSAADIPAPLREELDIQAVSYTHLTLPTICSV